LYRENAQFAHLRAELPESYDEQEGVSQGVGLPQHVVVFPHLVETAFAPPMMFGAEMDFSIRPEPHAGHTDSVSSPLSRTNNSTTSPHAAQRNS